MGTPQMIEQQNRILAKKEICIKNSSVDISPIKKVSAKQVASPKKKASNLPLPKLTIPKNIAAEQKEKLTAYVPNKIAAVQKENLPGTPQPTDPGNLLKRNLKRKVDVRMDKKIDEIPKNSSPYTLVMTETENGSPVEQFVKMNSKPSKENVTGTPAPALKKRQNRILQPLDNTVEGSPCPLRRKSPRLLATPKNLTPAIKSTKPDELLKTPKLELENQAVNKALAKQNVAHSNANTANSGGQIITGDLASLCVIM